MVLKRYIIERSTATKRTVHGKEDTHMEADRLKRQINFIVELDKLKHVFRQTPLLNGSRYENDAEHSWHVALMALLLLEYADEEGLNLFRVVKMLLVHDLVEIDAGDTFIYDEDKKDKRARENAAAQRIFSILPSDQAREYRSLWEEFEKRESREAKFAAGMDRLEPLLYNYHTKGASWKKHGIKSSQVIERNRHIGEASSMLWEFAKNLIEASVARGYLTE